MEVHIVKLVTLEVIYYSQVNNLATTISRSLLQMIGDYKFAVAYFVLNYEFALDFEALFKLNLFAFHLSYVKPECFKKYLIVH